MKIYRMLLQITLYCIKRFQIPALGQEVKNIGFRLCNLMGNEHPHVNISEFKLSRAFVGCLPLFYIHLLLLLTIFCC
jgi:hypothetical protein